MFTLDPSDGLNRVCRVTLRGAGGNRLRAQLRLEQALQAVDWCAGLPPRALLFVRRLAPGSGPSAFSRRVSDALARCAAQACRPWLQAHAAGAPAVLFNDDAELAACLVRDWLRGTLAQHWWWSAVLGGADAQDWLQRQVLARGERVLPVVARLVEAAATTVRPAALVEAWFARLDEQRTRDAGAVVARAYALHEAVIRRPAPAPGGAPARPGTPAPSATAAPSIETVPDAQAQAALRRLVAKVPELRDSPLSAPQRRLLAQVLALLRAPSWARSAQCAQALAAVEQAAPAPAVLPGEAPGSAVRAARAGAAASTAGPGKGTGRVRAPAATGPREPGDGRRGRRRRGGGPPHATPVVAWPDAPAAVAPGSGCPEPLVSPDDGPCATAQRQPSPQKAGVDPVAIAHTGVHTRFGGVFYLLNAALALGLYGDFTQPRRPGLALSPWDWLALVGRAWFGEAFVAEPVWALLAALAGRRAAAAPGRDFTVPREWSIDPDWLAPWGRADALQVRATRRRLRVHHPQGFVVFDVARESALRPLAQARGLCTAHEALRAASLRPLRRGPAGPAVLPRTGTARWMRQLLGYLQPRLALALGEDAAAVPALLCRHEARVRVDEAAVDVALDLAALPLEIRIAGLDRDPGWIPAAGRSLYFHFS